MKGLPPEKIAELAGFATRQQNADIERVITECLELANKEYPLVAEYHNDWPVYERPTVKFDLRGKVAGWASSNNEIRLNIELLNNKELYNEMLNQTLPHEIAHCIIFQKYGPHTVAPHGYEWANVMRIFGKPALRTHNMPTKKARIHKRPYQYLCKCRVHKVTSVIHKRIQGGQVRRCKLCYADIRKENYIGLDESA